MATPDRWTIEVDRDACMGSGTCLLYVPGSLELDDQGKAARLPHPTDDLDAAQAAVDACPTRALRVAIET
jgi:ferredoxin